MKKVGSVGEYVRSNENYGPTILHLLVQMILLLIARARTHSNTVLTAGTGTCWKGTSSGITVCRRSKYAQDGEDESVRIKLHGMT